MGMKKEGCPSYSVASSTLSHRVSNSVVSASGKSRLARAENISVRVEISSEERFLIVTLFVIP